MTEGNSPAKLLAFFFVKECVFSVRIYLINVDYKMEEETLIIYFFPFLSILTLDRPHGVG